MKNALVYVLLLATLLPIVSSWGTLAYYQVNKAYIARVLCQNRDKPQLHCDGKCYLARQLKAQQDKQDKETTKRVENLPVLQLVYTDPLAFTFKQTADPERCRAVFAYQLRSYSAFITPVFQPPGVGC